jgi:poly-gamma-glutamate capsule biosynthesis protein CapA/YwtB (metallophosphatase superfamily)
MSPDARTDRGTQPSPGGVRLFLCGDVMTGRGIDQVLPHPGKAELFESYMRSAVGYVELAERMAGPIGRRLDFACPWGEALGVLQERRPDARIINLETAITTSDEALAGKGIHYRMHPGNLPCITAAGIDCCVLANNHVLDWGSAGLLETLTLLQAAGVRTAGAGRDAHEAAAPAVMELPASGARLLVFGYATPTSGTPPAWAATRQRGGINFLGELTERAAQIAAETVRCHRRAGDVVVVSVHWGGNWGFHIPREQQAFARMLIDAGGADIVYGHSSHHVKGIEVHGGKLILYGCGDLLNDYEGISGHDQYRSDLSLMYFPALDPANGGLRGLDMVPMRMRRFRLERACAQDVSWLRGTLDREGRALGTHVAADEQGTLSLGW